MQMTLDWGSEGTTARVALIIYGMVALAACGGLRSRVRTIRRLLPWALLWHLVVFLFEALWFLPFYAAQADCYWYHRDGMMVAQLIRSGNWGGISWGLGTAAIPIITGFLYAPFGGDVYGVLFFSAVLGLCGGLYLCRAFSLWATDEQLRRYSLIVLFLPSFALWTSIFGKDSWIMLGLGLTAYGYSSMLKLNSPIGMWHLLAGVAIVTVIRPHIAVTLVASMSFAYLCTLAQKRSQSIGAKFMIALILIAMFALVGSVARGFLGLSDISADSMQEYARTHEAGSATGGSAVEVQAASGAAGALLAFPRGILRVLFQPFPWEIENFNTGLAAVENLFILWFGLSHAGRLLEVLRGIIRPYILFSSLLACALLLMLSLTPNLGLLSRERVQLLPFMFAPLIAAATPRRRLVPRVHMPRVFGGRVAGAVHFHIRTPVSFSSRR